MFILSLPSKKVYDTLHHDLQLTIDTLLEVSPIDFALVEGYRDTKTQFEYYTIGRKFSTTTLKWEVEDENKIITNTDGINIKSYHNHSPSLAVDIRVYIPNRPDLAYDAQHLILIAGFFLMSALQLRKQGKITSEIVWGGNWDGDGMIIYDHKLIDLPHFQIKTNG